LSIGGEPYPWGFQSHATALVGWGTIDKSTSNHISGIPNPIQSDWYGYNYWIYKDSFGPAGNNKGYKYIMNFSPPQTTYVVNLPITSLTRTDANVRCVDEDGDGYYYWGIGPKPAHCPECPDEPDGDDSNPSLGPLNEFGQCTIIDTYNANFETGWDNWVQIGTDDGDWLRHSGEVITPMYPIPGAQNGDYFIYVNSSCNGCYPYKTFIIESPPINLTNKSCGAQIDFYYYIHTYLWNNPDNTKLELQISYDDGQTWVANYWYIQHNQGSGWKHATVRFPASVNKVRFVGTTGSAYMSDIALDNITIGPSKDPDLVININTIWNSNNDIYGDIVITNNSTLIISNCIISLSDNCKITIHPGAKLVIDGGTLTNACPNQLWQGIVVSGDKMSTGTVQVTNGGTIKNAVCGIKAKSGGSVIATDALFVNNTIGVLFEPNALGGTFTLTSFTLDNAYLGNPAQFEAHIKMQNSGDVFVKGCTFSSTAQNAVSVMNNGIKATNSYLDVKEYCPMNAPWPYGGLTCDERYLTRNSFSGFSYAISSVNAGSGSKLYVRYSNFNNNLLRGISISGTNYATVIKNSFDVARHLAYGMGVSNATGFKIEENIFTGLIPPSASSATIGLAVNNSGSAENEVYKNDYYNLFIGQEFLSKNSSQTDTVPCTDCPPERGIPPVVTGLQTLCNTFNNNKYSDIFVGFWGQPYNMNSIRDKQGNSQNSAGNKFYGTPTTPTYNIDNILSQHNINYYWRNAIEEPKKIIDKVTPIYANAANSCPSKLVTGGGQQDTKGGEDIEELLSKYSEWNDIYEYWLALFIAFEGEENTEEYNMLLNNVSYYSSLKDNFFNWIIATASNEEEKEQEEGEKGEIENPKLRFEKLRFLFGYRNHYVDNLSIAETYFAENNYGEASATLANMYEQFEITEEQVMELRGLEIYAHWLQQLEDEGQNIYELSESGLDYLVNYVETNSGRGKVFANNILCELYGICMEDANPEYTISQEPTDDYIIEPIIPTQMLQIDNKALLDVITLIPNPTTGELRIESGQVEVDKVELLDIVGRVIFSQNFISSLHQKIDISHINSGIYFVKITTDIGEVVKKVVKQ